MPACTDETLTELRGCQCGKRKAQGLRSVFYAHRAAPVGQAPRLLFGRLPPTSLCSQDAPAPIQVGLVDTAGGTRTCASRMADRA